MQKPCDLESEIAVFAEMQSHFPIHMSFASNSHVKRMLIACESQSDHLSYLTLTPPCRSVVDEHFAKEDEAHQTSLWASGTIGEDDAQGMGHPSLKGLRALVALLIGLPSPWRVDDSSTLCDLGCGLGHVLVQSVVDPEMPQLMRYYGVDIRRDRVRFCNKVARTLEAAQQSRVRFEFDDALSVDLTGSTHVYLYDYLFHAETVRGAPPPPHPRTFRTRFTFVSRAIHMRLAFFSHPFRVRSTC